jgi:hypothetical protein
MVSSRIPKRFMTAALRLGVGLKRLLLVITKLIWEGFTPVFSSSSATQEKQVVSYSSRATSMPGLVWGAFWMAGTTAVASPSPER